MNMLLHNFSHFMQIWFLPPGLFLALMLFSFLLIWKGYKKIGKKLFSFTYILFWLFCTPLFAQAFIDGLQKQYPPLEFEKKVKISNSAIVVLGSGVEQAFEFPEQYRVTDITLSRLHYAAYLHNKLQVPMIVSGGNHTNTAITEAEAMRTILQKDYNISVPIIEKESRNTLEESKLLAPIIKKNNIQTIYLVTHAWHMPRSILAFKSANITVIPAPMGFISLKSESTLINLLPSLNALNTCAFALHEYIGIVWYWFVSKN